MHSIVLASLVSLALAAPKPVAEQEKAFPANLRAPRIPTRTAREPTRVQRRQVDVGGYLDELFSNLGDIPRYVASGIPQFFQDLPQGDEVLEKLGLNDNDLDAKPTQVLNIPGYANWTGQAWNLLVHGQVYKDPGLDEEKLNDLADVFLVNTDLQDLQPSEQEQARNLTRAIFSVPQGDQNVTFTFVPNFTPPNEEAGGLVAAEGGEQTIKYPGATTDLGDFAAFIQLQNTAVQGQGGYIQAGDSTNSIQALNYYAGNATLGNATAYLVPPTGYTIISDIDDILRVTKIYQPDEGLLNSFAKPFVPWMNMPDIYSTWAQTVPDLHFHYLTTTPEQATPNYMDFIYKTYPLGSFDTRPLNFSDVEATLNIRRFLLNRIFETYPERKFMLVGDTSNSDVLKEYPALAERFPNQVGCIWIRNVTSTDREEFKFPYNTKEFEKLNSQMYMFFNVPDDLRGLNFVAGQCVNSTVKQEPTFDYQNVPLQDAAVAGKISFGALMLTAGVAAVAALANAL